MACRGERFTRHAKLGNFLTPVFPTPVLKVLDPFRSVVDLRLMKAPFRNAAMKVVPVLALALGLEPEGALPRFRTADAARNRGFPLASQVMLIK